MNWYEEMAARLDDLRELSEVQCETHGTEPHQRKVIPVDNGTTVTELVGFHGDGYSDTPGYCPGDDDVSRTLSVHGRWEPEETDIFRRAVARSTGGVIDFGTHIGWYTMIGLAMRRPVLAVEALREHEELTLLNARRNQLDDRLYQAHRWVDYSIPQLDPDGPTIAIVKMDLEGSEWHAFHCIEMLLYDGKVDNVLMEVSPCFNDGYPALVDAVMEYLPFAATVNPWQEFGSHQIDQVVQAQPQIDMIFSREAWWAR